MFTPNGDTVFLSEQSQDDLLNSGEGDRVATMASKPTEDGRFQPVAKGGGLYTTQLHDGRKCSLQMGDAGAAGAFAERHGLRPLLQHDLRNGIEQRAAQVAVVVAAGCLRGDGHGADAGARDRT